MGRFGPGVQFSLWPVVTDIERQTALDGGRRIKLEASNQEIHPLRCTLEISFATSERQLVSVRHYEDVCPIKIFSSAVELAIKEELFGVVKDRSLPGVVSEQRPSVSKTFGDLRLQRIVAIVSAVAEIVDALRPAVLDKEGLNLLGSRPGKNPSAVTWLTFAAGPPPAKACVPLLPT